MPAELCGNVQRANLQELSKALVVHQLRLADPVTNLPVEEAALTARRQEATMAPLKYMGEALGGLPQRFAEICEEQLSHLNIGQNRS